MSVLEKPITKPVSKPAAGGVKLCVTADLAHRGGPGPNDAPLSPPSSTFQALGGREAVARIVDGLYDRIEGDSLLRPAFGRSMAHERERQKVFFEEWFGGDARYFESDWPPGLKAAHGAISISRDMADRWLGHFRASLAAAVDDPAVVGLIQPSVERLAGMLVNRPDEPVPGERLRCTSRVADFDSFLSRLKTGETVVDTTPASHSMSSKEEPTLLSIAAVRGRTETVREMLRRGADPNMPVIMPGGERTQHGLPLLPITPLCAALARRRTAVAQLLVEHGAKYDIFTASYLGDLDAVRELLDGHPELAGASDPACDVAAVTALTHAVAGGQLEVARLLLERGAGVGRHSARLIRDAASHGDEALVDLLLDHGADAASIGAGDWVLHPSIAEKLLSRGADVNREPGAWIGMCCTGNSGHRENTALARAMLRCGADVRARYKGRTALHCAAKAGFVHVVEALIEHGADVNALDASGRTPLDEADHAGKSIDPEPVRRLLIAHGARRS